MSRRVSSRWKAFALLFSIVGMAAATALAQGPGSQRAFFQAWWGTKFLSGFVQKYPNAIVAYSLRELSSAYSGQNLIIARRSSDNDERGFTEAEIKNGTLESWAGTNNAFVATWHDQSGNDYHLIQTNNLFQPKIVSAGSLVTSGGFPAAQGDGIDDFMQVSISLSSSGDLPFTRLVVREVVTAGSTSESLLSILPDESPFPVDRRAVLGAYDNSNTLSIRLYGGNAVYNHVHSGLELFASMYSSGGGSIPSWINSQSLSVKSFSNSGLNMQTNSVAVLFSGVPGANIDAKLCEAIFYFTDYSSQRQEMEDEINAYYDFY